MNIGYTDQTLHKLRYISSRLYASTSSHCKMISSWAGTPETLILLTQPVDDDVLWLTHMQEYYFKHHMRTRNLGYYFEHNHFDLTCLSHFLSNQVSVQGITNSDLETRKVRFLTRSNSLFLRPHSFVVFYYKTICCFFFRILYTSTSFENLCHMIL